MRSAGIKLMKKGDSKLMGHDNPTQTSSEGKFSFCFIRNPLDWFKSYWSFRMRNGWHTKTHQIDQTCSSMDFNEFISRVLEKMPGYCTRFFESYIGTKEKPLVSFVGRQENLTKDLISALNQAGEKFDKEAILKAPPVNCRGPYKPEYDKDLKNEVIQTEIKFMRRFGYL